MFAQPRQIYKFTIEVYHWKFRSRLHISSGGNQVNTLHRNHTYGQGTNGKSESLTKELKRT